MSWLLDTCVLSELVKPKPDAGLVAWVASSDEARLYVSALTLGDLAKGIARLPPGTKRNRLQTWLDRDLAERFSGRILSIDQSVAVRWGVLQALAEKAGRPMPVIDGLIAATAACHDLAVVTRNGGDMASSGIRILNPWSG